MIDTLFNLYFLHFQLATYLQKPLMTLTEIKFVLSYNINQLILTNSNIPTNLLVPHVFQAFKQISNNFN